MGWQDIDLTTVSTQPETLPEKTFTWELNPGARLEESGRISATATVVNDGEHTGRRVTFSFADPHSFDKNGNSNEWVTRQLVRLLSAMGVDIVAGETAVTSLNRAAGSRFIAPITHSKPQGDGGPVYANLKLNNPKPAA